MSVNSLVMGRDTTSLLQDWHSVASLIDHTLLSPAATGRDIMRLCADAKRYAFCSVMVNPAWVTLAAAQVHGSPVKVGTVIGFPLGANLTVIKLAEAEAAAHNGAHDLDMVINIGALKSGDRVLVQTEIRSLVKLAHAHGAILKAIIETALLNQEEKILACALAADAGIDFVKTSTGFAASGATAADVALMRGVVGHDIGVKAAGGIRTAAQLSEMVEAGANRIGASSSVAIIRELGAPADEL
ncbi:MAG: deoxyribose-phosphate aldolase [Candidatus Korobacteraceae bacterium]